MANITEVRIWWDDQDANNEGWCARSYDGNEQLNDVSLDDLADDASDDELIAALPRSWKDVENINIVR